MTHLMSGHRNVWKILVMVTALSSITGVEAGQGAPFTEQQKADAVVRLLESFGGSDPHALDVVDQHRYVQHNPRVEDGLAGLKKRLATLPLGSHVKVARVLADGDFIITHSELDFSRPYVAFDMFRFDGNRIVEHWDNVEAKCESPNASGRTQLDGPTEVTDRDKTESNKALVREYFEVVVIGGHRDRATQYRTTFHQHNCFGEDNKSGFQTASGPFAKPGFVYRVDKLHTVLGQGNYVLAVNEGLFDNKPSMFYDFYRLENNMMVEHWDVIEEIPPEQEWKNSNGKF
jgi:predicted SnoaL-like aldol condensation-catalyzing enzyme